MLSYCEIKKKLEIIEENIVKREKGEIVDDLDANKKIPLDLEFGVWFRNSGKESGEGEHTHLLNATLSKEGGQDKFVVAALKAFSAQMDVGCERCNLAGHWQPDLGGLNDPSALTLPQAPSERDSRETLVNHPGTKGKHI